MLRPATTYYGLLRPISYSPFVRRKPGHHEESEGDQDVGSQHVQPDLYREWVQEAEETGWLGGRYLGVREKYISSGYNMGGARG